MARESGALYVRIGDTLHPVLNLASARLDRAQSAATPLSSPRRHIAERQAGPDGGHPGCAGDDRRAACAQQPWTVCDGDRTVVAVGDANLDGSTRSRTGPRHPAR